MLENRLATGCLLVALLALAGVSPAAAATDYLWPRFTVDAGAYEISTTDEVRVDGEIELLERPIEPPRWLGLRSGAAGGRLRPMHDDFRDSPAGVSRGSRRRWAAVALALCAALAPPAAAAEPAGSGAPSETPPTRVLVLHAFGTNFAPFTSVVAAMRTGLSGAWPGPVEFLEVPLELARYDARGEETLLLEYLRTVVARRPVALVVAVAGPAVRFAFRHRAELFPSVPILGTAVDRRLLESVELGPLDAVVSVAHDLPRTVEGILQVLPQTRTVAVVIGASPLEQFWRAELARELAPFEDRVRLLWLDGLSLPEMLRRTATLPPQSAIFFVMLAVDAAGIPHESGQVLSELAAAANAPVFGLYDVQLGQGIVGGSLLSTTELSRQAVEVATRILGGEPAGRFRLPPAVPGAPRFDERQLRRWKIPESRLPAGSAVLFRGPSPWEGVLWPFVGTLVIVALQAALIGSLLVERRRRRAARADVQALNWRLLGAAEEERRRLARELHDDLAQRLARLAIDATLLERGDPAPPESATPGAIRDEILRLSADLHAVSHRLHPSLLYNLGLAEALRAEAERFARGEGFAVDLQLDERVADFDPERGLALYRVAQEALRNVARHARATRVGLAVRAVDGGVELVVRDDGAGFDPAIRREGWGLGLVSMRERLALVGGRLRIDSAPGRGTSVTAWAPPAEGAS